MLCTHTFVLFMHSCTYVCTTLGLTHPRNHANRVSGVEEYDVRDVHPGIVSDTLTMRTYSFLLSVDNIEFLLDCTPVCLAIKVSPDFLQQKMTFSC